MKKTKSFILSILSILLIFACEQNEKIDKNVEQESAKSEQINQEMAHQASGKGDLKTVKEFIQNGGDVNKINEQKQSMLMFAAFNGYYEICEYLIENGAKIDHLDNLGRSALTYASSGPFPQTVELLLKYGANPNNIDQGEHWTPLMNAASEGQLEVVKILLKYGADKNLKDVDGDTAESFARLKDHKQVVDYLNSFR